MRTRSRRARPRDDPRPPRDRRRVLVHGPRAPDRLRPRVRAGAAHRHRAGARPHAPPAGRRGGLVRVHGDAVRPRAARRLQGRADDDRAVDLGQGSETRRSPTSRSRPAKTGSCARGSGTSRTSSTACSTAGSERLSRFRDQIEDERESMHGRFTSFKEHVADETGRLTWFRSKGAIPLVVATVLFALVGGAPRLPRRAAVAPRVPALFGRRCSSASAPASSRTPRSASARSCSTAVRGGGARGRSGGGRALGGVPPLPLGLPAPPGGAARNARAMGALPRLRDHVRDRRARAAGRAAPHARGRCTRRARSTGSHRTATSARAPRASRSATSLPASEARSLPRIRDRGEAAAASPAAVAVAAEAAAAGSASAGHVHKSDLVPDEASWHAARMRRGQHGRSDALRSGSRRRAPIDAATASAPSQTTPFARRIPRSGVSGACSGPTTEQDHPSRKDMRQCSPRETRATSSSR